MRRHSPFSPVLASILLSLTSTNDGRPNLYPSDPGSLLVDMYWHCTLSQKQLRKTKKWRNYSIHLRENSQSLFFFSERKNYYSVEVRVPVSDGEGSGVSGSIRSIKMYSCAQFAMQEKSMCCRDVPCLVHTEQGPDPLHPEHLPTSFSAWVLGTQSTSTVALNKDGPGQCSGHLQAAQPRNCGPRKVYVNIVLYFPSSNTVFWNAYPND
jgi:hypothetical protein